MKETLEILRSLPSVDEILKTGDAQKWLEKYPRRFVIKAIREGIDAKRHEIFEEPKTESAYDLTESIMSVAFKRLSSFTSFRLKPVINATGVVIHTNLGRSPLSKKVLENIVSVASGYSNLEYDLETGKRGKRYTHVVSLLKELTGAEDAVIVNNNAAAVLLCLSSLAKGREVIVSRGELVEIGGSFRIPDIMVQSGSVLREVGTTNKTHLYDYEKAIHENTGMFLKVHQSNYRMIGFTEEVSIEDLVRLARKHSIPVMVDLGSGCFVDLKTYGIHSEPMVQDIVKKEVDIITLSGDKLLGGPQGGVIIGKKRYIEFIQKHPLMRAMRVDKFTLSAFEATLMEYADTDRASRNIPTLKMLFQDRTIIKKRAKRIVLRLRKRTASTDITLSKDSSQAGGGSLPEAEFPTYVVSIKPHTMSVNALEKRLRSASTPVIGRIKEESLLLDARTIMDDQIEPLVDAIINASEL